MTIRCDHQRVIGATLYKIQAFLYLHPHYNADMSRYPYVSMRTSRLSPPSKCDFLHDHEISFVACICMHNACRKMICKVVDLYGNSVASGLFIYFYKFYRIEIFFFLNSFKSQVQTF